MSRAEASRSDFESTFSSLPYEWDLSRFGKTDSWPGQYKAYHVQCAWEAWRECINSSVRHRTDAQ